MKTTVIVILTMLGLWVFAEFWPWRIGGHQAPGLPQRRPKTRDDDEMHLLQQRLWPDGWEHLLDEPQNDTTTTDEGTHP